MVIESTRNDVKFKHINYIRLEKILRRKEGTR